MQDTVYTDKDNNTINLNQFDKFTSIDNHIYVYIRVSTEKQDIYAQMVEVYNYCVKERLYPPSKNIYIEHGISGTISWKERKIYNIVELSKKDDIIIIPEISRLGRNMNEVNQIIGICSEKKVIIIDIKNKLKLDGTFQNSIMASLYTIFSQMERQLISERTKQGMIIARQKGKLTGRKRGTKTNKLILPHIDTIKTRLNENISIRKIAKEINVDHSYLGRYIKEHDLKQKQ
jgi:DNA invertase Pin-like site-specific DNA recombinase